MRFHLLDRIEEVSYGKYITGVKCITLADDVFNEHFPGYPIFPGSLIMESLAQLGGSFFEIMMQHWRLPLKRSVLTIVNRFKFRRPAEPGDRRALRADIVSMQDEYGVVSVRAEIEGQVCAEGELTFSFVNAGDDRLQKSREELYAICMKNARIIPDENNA
jgi:3-hydroxyacyl-[acyl-carrier-protein] dehydratase